MFGTYRDGLCPGISVVEGGQTSTGSAVAWLHRLLGSPGYAELDKEAAGVPPGAEGLVCLDHFQGNRTPHTDAASRGAFVGLTLRHSRQAQHWGEGGESVVAVPGRKLARRAPGPWKRNAFSIEPRR